MHTQLVRNAANIAQSRPELDVQLREAWHVKYLFSLSWHIILVLFTHFILQSQSLQYFFSSILVYCHSLTCLSLQKHGKLPGL
ncbi:hypothetical protein BDZ91DRAFT_747440 [Kalaharituber pfeilii]|nr:hypothetical protein BDZ91DRAFT_747440 [Kalaharituber pfeilii]